MEDDHDLRFDRGDETPERLKAQLSRLVGMTAAQAHRAAGDALRAVDAHKDHFVVLAALAEFGPASQSALAGRARIYKSDLVSVLNELADGGWIRRAPDRADKRRNVITITSAGERRLTDLDRILEDVNNQVMAPLTPAERTQLLNLLTRVNTHLATPSSKPGNGSGRDEVGGG
ncbi:MarR family winged helix-turn-helix transcriptional regulator [Kribbella shirazensis]|uniref:DNA-binding MarR family transcriptional regulator n=1 Tax=Kribbella shirazensis TaxID=1105143 RepID=A0A7X5V6K1_9ACTN|nr:MarR family transcriptional regulator [Kribbella shirazensis]NIK55527.1 DNA-binding MarR family transcriptional regulator [Kribbella shirazensis]